MRALIKHNINSFFLVLKIVSFPLKYIYTKSILYKIYIICSYIAIKNRLQCDYNINYELEL